MRLARFLSERRGVLGALGLEGGGVSGRELGEARVLLLLEAARAGGMRVKQMLPQPLAAVLLHSHEVPRPPTAPGDGTADVADSAVGGAGELVLVVDVGGSSTCASVVLRRHGAGST